MVLKFLCQDSKVAWEKKTMIRQKYPAHPGILQSCLAKGDYVFTEKLENETDGMVSCSGLVPAWFIPWAAEIVSGYLQPWTGISVLENN